MPLKWISDDVGELQYFGPVVDGLACGTGQGLSRGGSHLFYGEFKDDKLVKGVLYDQKTKKPLKILVAGAWLDLKDGKFPDEHAGFEKDYDLATAKELNVEDIMDGVEGAKFQAQKRATHTSEEWLRLFRHGRIYFEDSGTEAQFLLPPPDLEDPYVVLKALMDPRFFGMRRPELFMYADECMWKGDTPQCDEKPMKFHKPSWDAGREQEQFQSRSSEIGQAMAQAMNECNGWLVAPEANMWGGWGGRLLGKGLASLRRQGRDRHPHFLGLAQGCKFKTNEGGMSKVDGCSHLHEYIFVGIKDNEFDLQEVAVPLDKEPMVRATYPAFEEALCRGHTADWRLLNPHCTHYVFCHDRQNNLWTALYNLMLNGGLLPSVLVLLGGCFNTTWLANVQFDRVSAGATAVVLDKTGPIPTRMANAVRKRRKRGGEDDHSNHHDVLEPFPDTSTYDEREEVYKKVWPDWEGYDMSALTLPTNIDLEKFLIFDGPKESIETIVSRLTMVLTNTTRDTDIGFAAGERARLRSAWKIIATFQTNAAAQCYSANYLFAASTLCSLLTTIIAVLVTDYKRKQHADDDELLPAEECIIRYLKYLSIAASVLPLISALILSIRSNLNPLVKASQLRTGSKRITREIYLYRARVQPYVSVRDDSLEELLGLDKKSLKARTQLLDAHRVWDLNGSLASSDAGTEDVSPSLSPSGISPGTSSAGQQVGKASRGANRKKEDTASKAGPRDILYQRLKEIQTATMKGDISADALIPPTQQELNHVTDNLYGPRKKHWCGKICSRLKNLFKARAPTTDGISRPSNEDMPLLIADDEHDFDSTIIGMTDNSTKNDDGVSGFSAEDHVCFRLLPSLKSFTTKAQKYLWYQRFLQTLLVSMTTLTGVLGLFGGDQWMPIAVGFTSAITGILEYFQVSEQLRRTNDAISELRNQQIWWESLSLVQKRFSSTKEHLVTTVEDIIYNEDCMTFGASSLSTPPEKGKKKKKSSKDKRRADNHNDDNSSGDDSDGSNI